MGWRGLETIRRPRPSPTPNRRRPENKETRAIARVPLVGVHGFEPWAPSPPEFSRQFMAVLLSAVKCLYIRVWRPVSIAHFCLVSDMFGGAGDHQVTMSLHRVGAGWQHLNRKSEAPLKRKAFRKGVLWYSLIGPPPRSQGTHLHQCIPTRGSR